MLQRAIRASHFDTISEKPEIRFRETSDIGQHRREIARADAEPGRERGAVFIDARAWNPPSPARIVVGAPEVRKVCSPMVRTRG